MSPAYFEYGIIIGPSINAFTLLGAVIGFGILSLVAKHNGWAPGPVDSWENGSRGWILWVGMGLILGDSAIGLGWLILKPLLLWSRRMLEAHRHRSKLSFAQGLEEQTPLLQVPLGNLDGVTTTQAVDDDWHITSLISTPLVLWTGGALLAVYFGTLLLFFQEYVSLLHILVATLLIPIASFIAMRSLGETDIRLQELTNEAVEAT